MDPVNYHAMSIRQIAVSNFYCQRKILETKNFHYAQGYVSFFRLYIYVRA